MLDTDGYPTYELEQVLSLLEWIERFKPPYVETSWLQVRNGICVRFANREHSLLLAWFALFGADIENVSLIGVSLFKDNILGGTQDALTQLGDKDVIY